MSRGCPPHHVSGRDLATAESALKLIESRLDEIRRAAVRLPLTEADTLRSNQSILSIRRTFNARWFTAAKGFRGKISAAAPENVSAVIGGLEKGWHRAIREAWESAWKVGFQSRGVIPPTTSRQIYAASPQLRAEVERQLLHASRFAMEYAAGIPDTRGRVPFGTRSQLYSRAINAAFQWGAVLGGPKGEQIIWKLGACDHCTDCPAIAASGPYTRDTLPTVPGQGLTKCSHNCCCSLVFKPGAATRKQPPRDLVRTVVAEPDAPVGFRGPNDSELLVILDMEARINYARRMMARAAKGSDDHRMWMRRRSQVNGDLIDLLEARGIYWTPRFSVGEVITGEDILLGDIDRLLLRGANGVTIQAGDLDVLLKAVEAEFVALSTMTGMETVPPVSPFTPEIERIMKRLGVEVGD